MLAILQKRFPRVAAHKSSEILISEGAALIKTAATARGIYLFYLYI